MQKVTNKPVLPILRFVGKTNKAARVDLLNQICREAKGDAATCVAAIHYFCTTTFETEGETTVKIPKKNKEKLAPTTGDERLPDLECDEVKSFFREVDLQFKNAISATFGDFTSFTTLLLDLETIDSLVQKLKDGNELRFHYRSESNRLGIKDDENKASPELRRNVLHHCLGAAKYRGQRNVPHFARANTAAFFAAGDAPLQVLQVTGLCCSKSTLAQDAKDWLEIDNESGVSRVLTKARKSIANAFESSNDDYECCIFIYDNCQKCGRVKFQRNGRTSDFTKGTCSCYVKPVHVKKRAEHGNPSEDGNLEVGDGQVSNDEASNCAGVNDVKVTYIDQAIPSFSGTFPKFEAITTNLKRMRAVRPGKKHPFSEQETTGKRVAAYMDTTLYAFRGSSTGKLLADVERKKGLAVEKCINYETLLTDMRCFIPRTVKLWRGKTDVSQFLIMPVSAMDETTTLESGAFILSALVDCGILERHADPKHQGRELYKAKENWLKILEKHPIWIDALSPFELRKM